MKKIAKKLEKMGRKGDTILAHINPREARLLDRVTDGGSRNPRTGLLEFMEGDGAGDGGGGGDGGGNYNYGDYNYGDYSGVDAAIAGASMGNTVAGGSTAVSGPDSYSGGDVTSSTATEADLAAALASIEADAQAKAEAEAQALQEAIAAEDALAAAYAPTGLLSQAPTAPSPAPSEPTVDLVDYRELLNEVAPPAPMATEYGPIVGDWSGFASGMTGLPGIDTSKGETPALGGAGTLGDDQDFKYEFGKPTPPMTLNEVIKSGPLGSIITMLERHFENQRNVPENPGGWGAGGFGRGTTGGFQGEGMQGDGPYGGLLGGSAGGSAGGIPPGLLTPPRARIARPTLTRKWGQPRGLLGA